MPVLLEFGEVGSLLPTPVLPAINPLCGFNAGGLLGCVRLYPASNVRAVPPLVAGSHVGGLTLRDANAYLDVWFTPGSGEFEEPEDKDPAGFYYKPRLSLAVAKDDPELVASLALLREYRYFVALFKDGNGLTKLVGSPDTPLVFAAALSTGQRPTDPNLYKLVLSGETSEAAGFFDTFVAVAGPGRRSAFSSGFNFGF